MRREVEFKSNGVTCRGVLVTPDYGQAPYPVVVMAGGWCYVKEIVMPHYAEYLVAAGNAVLLFDYRCLGASDGLPRQHIDPWAQIEDYKNAITFAQTLPELDPDRVGIWGISYSGGHVLVVAATDPRVKCVVSNIPVVDGCVNMRRVHGERRYAQLVEELQSDRRQRWQDPEQRGRIPMSSPDPEHELSCWPFPHVGEVFSAIKEREAPLHEHWSTTESVELLLNYTVFPYVKRIFNLPTLMVVAEGDNITLWDLEIEAFNQITSNQKKLVVLPNVSHMSLYSQRSHLEVAGEAAAEWFKTHLVGLPQREAVAS